MVRHRLMFATSGQQQVRDGCFSDVSRRLGQFRVVSSYLDSEEHQRRIGCAGREVQTYRERRRIYWISGAGQVVHPPQRRRTPVRGFCFLLFRTV
jgi:hypothetical protein